MSPRRGGPFIIVDATTIPDNLFESELFGHEKGAFTGAERQKMGLLELADQGTLFIDEIGEIPWNMQAKLLRALQEKRFSRVGGTRVIKSDFRLITATNRDLSQEVQAGRFRNDLYYRINTVTISIPPLRERQEDIVILAEHFIGVFDRKYQQPEHKMSPDDRERLLAYHWPGNVRELKNVVERSVLLSSGARLELNLPLESGSQFEESFDDCPALDEVQRRYIRFILKKTNGRIGGPGGAADLLDMKRTTLIARMKKLGLKESFDRKSNGGG